MSITKERKQQVVEEFRKSAEDTGSPEVQIAILTRRVNELTEHMRTHKRDYSSRRGLMILVSKRNRMLRYLARLDRLNYQALIGRLGLRK